MKSNRGFSLSWRTLTTKMSFEIYKFTFDFYIHRYYIGYTDSNIYIADILAAPFSKRSVSQSGHNCRILIVTIATIWCTCKKPSNRTLPYPFRCTKVCKVWEKFTNQYLFWLIPWWMVLSTSPHFWTLIFSVSSLAKKVFTQMDTWVLDLIFEQPWRRYITASTLVFHQDNTFQQQTFFTWFKAKS